MTRFTDATCAQFSAALADRSSVPGGGGAAALTGALAAALCAMVTNFTLGKPKYAPFEPRLRALLDRAEALRLRLLELVEEDAAAFLPLSAAYALPREDPARPHVLSQASLEACQPPLEMVRQAAQVVELLEVLLDRGSPLLLSDVGCGAHLARGAMEAAALNLFVNTPALADRARARALEGEADGLLAQYVPRADAVARAVSARLRK